MTAAIQRRAVALLALAADALNKAPGERERKLGKKCLEVAAEMRGQIDYAPLAKAVHS